MNLNLNPLSLAFLLLFLLSNSFAFPAGSDTERPGSGSSGLSGILGWNGEVEKKYKPDEVLLFVVFPKKDYWQNDKVIGEIESLLKGVLDPDVNMEDPEDPAEAVYVHKYKNLGTPLIQVLGKYHAIADVIIDDFENKEGNERKRIGISDYLDTWGIIRAEDDFSEKMRRVDERRFLSEDEWTHGSEVETTRIRKGIMRKNNKGAVEYEFETINSDIRSWSKPPGITSEEWKSRPVYYEDSEGKDIDIFVLDSGFALDGAREHQEFADAIENGQIKGWLYAEGPLGANKPGDYLWSVPDEGWIDFHGTHVISKILGRQTGFSRKANVWVLERIEKETEENPKYRAIINMCTIIEYHGLGDELDPYPESALTTVERKFIEAYSRIADIVLARLSERENVIIVTGTGNDWLGRGPISEWPAKRGGSIENLVVLGSVDKKDRDSNLIPSKSQDEFEYICRGGISYAIPAVSGILATHMSANPEWSPKQAIGKLYNDAYPRAEGADAIKITWTGISP
ncbi:hypothetical protein Dda_3459 [Drechslerella dactyloides]|uniref:Uncharacterized protein n=1 Tax=Drechslerella dactyloides TaxID=74499 RepID=A0AAD6J5V3_DREDA|nr:hypothetical protein Dda_3459 [Drechslerella dactyloides]